MKYCQMEEGRRVTSEADGHQFERHYDVIVAGVGTTGACAVISAASRGVSVLGIEQLSGAGGMGTMGYVSGYYYGAAGGIQVEIDRTAEAMGQETFLNRVEPKKYILEKKMKTSGADLLFESVITGVFMEGTRLTGVSVFSDGHRRTFSCSVLIDATADAVVCDLAGCQTHCGRASDGKTRPFTSVKVSLNADGDIVRTNHDSGFVNQYDPLMLSRGILQAHASQRLKEFTEAGEKVIFFAPFVGIREGRLIEAEKMLRMEEVIAGVQEPEPLFYSYCDFDKHGKDNALESEALQDWFVASNLSTAILSVPVSVRSMIPKGYQSLLAAGRHMGFDHDVASMIRMQRDMQKCGESAGVCAALAARSGVQPANLPYEEIRKLLEESGCLTEAHHTGICFDDSFRKEKIAWIKHPQALRSALMTDMPGIAIYSCKLDPEATIPRLTEWLSCDHTELRYHSAIALALTGHRDSLPVLRQIVRKRDAYYFKDCRRTNQFRSAIAVYLLGKLADRESLPVLREILCDPGEYHKSLYHEIRESSYKLNTSKNFNELYFQMVSHSALAVTKIMARYPELRQEGASILTEAFTDLRHVEHTTTMPEETFEFETMNNVRQYALQFSHTMM